MKAAGFARIVPVVWAILAAGFAYAHNYPLKPIRIVTASVGGGDFVARMLAQGMAEPLGQPVVVENRSPSNLATETVAKAPPDGYTIIDAGGGLWIFPQLNRAN